MKTNELEYLIKRYYRAETTREEEQILLHIFQQEKVPTHLQKDKELFLLLHTSSEADNIPIPTGLKEKISTQIDLHEIQIHKKRIFLKWATGIAAAFLIAAAICMPILSSAPKQHYIDNPEEAYIETQKALTLFATKINKGVNSLQKAEETKQTISKQLNKKNG